MSRTGRAKLAVEYRPVEALIPYARNARTHSDVQVAEIAASIREFGFTNPILVDGDNGIIAGHGRLLAARKLDRSEERRVGKECRCRWAREHEKKKMESMNNHRRDTV